jgi:hypothetical protein
MGQGLGLCGAESSQADPIVVKVLDRVQNSAMLTVLERLLLRMRSKDDAMCAVPREPASLLRSVALS